MPRQPPSAARKEERNRRRLHRWRTQRPPSREAAVLAQLRVPAMPRPPRGWGRSLLSRSKPRGHQTPREEPTQVRLSSSSMGRIPRRLAIFGNPLRASHPRASRRAKLGTAATALRNRAASGDSRAPPPEDCLSPRLHVRSLPGSQAPRDTRNKATEADSFPVAPSALRSRAACARTKCSRHR